MQVTGGGSAAEPRVTVLIPTYNRAHWLIHAIESVLSQTVADLRLVVADNASTDETPEVVARYASDPRVVHVRHPENLGVIGNFQFCIGYRGSDYIKLMTDDDVLYPRLLERSLAVLDANPHAGLVHSSFDRVGPKDVPLMLGANWTHGLRRDTIEAGERFIRQSMLWSTRVDLPSTTFRAAALPPEGFAPEDFPAIDLGLYLRMARRWDVAFVAETLVASRVQGAGVSAEALGEFVEQTGYRLSFEHVDELLELKLRFISQAGLGADEANALRRLAVRCWRRDLISAARDSTLPTRRPPDAVRAIAAAARRDPMALAQRVVVKDLVASAIGPRRLAWLKARRAAHRSPGGTRR